MKTYKSYEVTLPQLHPGQQKMFEALKVFRFVIGCIPPDTVLLGSNKKIADVKIGDTVISRKGALTYVKKIFKRLYEGTLYTIKARYLLPIKCTDEHPILVTEVLRNDNYYAFSQGRRPHKTEWRPKRTYWITAKELAGLFKKDKYLKYCLNIPIPKGIHNTRKWDLIKVGRWNKDGYREFSLTKDTAWVLGLFAADGHTSKYHTIFTLGPKEEDLAKRTSQAFSDLGIKSVIKKRQNACFVDVGSVQIARLFRALCGQYCENKHIPEEILFHQDTEILQSFVEGYLAGDGYKNIDRFQAKTISQVLAQQLQLAFARLDQFAGISVKPEREEYIKTKTYFCQKQYLIDVSKTGETRTFYWRRPGYILVPIEDISSEAYNDNVYNLSCEDETFLVSNAVTHNCTGRRWGKTVGALIIMFHKALGQPNYVAWWVAPSYRISKRAYRLFKTICDRNLIEYISDTDMYVKLINGSIIEFKSSDRAEGLLGEGLNFVVFDEIAEAKPESWYMYIAPALSDKMGQALLLSRPHGNWFYDLCEEIQGSNEGVVMSFESRDNPYFPPEEWEAAKRRLPSAIFQAEYMAQWVRGASAVFPNAKDVLVPTSPKYHVPSVVGVDPGRTRDFFFISVVNIKRQIIYLAHYRGMPFNEQIDVIRNISIKYDGHVYIDSHVLGYGLYDMLKASDIGPRVTAWPIKDPKARAMAVETLALELDPTRIEHFTLPTEFPSECQPSFDELMKELSSMDYKFMPNGMIKYETGTGIHDDGIVSLGLAAIGLNERFSRVIQITPRPVRRYNKPEMTRKFTVERKYSKRVALAR